MDSTFHLTVNGKNHAITTDRQRLLLEILREDVGLLGTRFGCGEGQCGCCSVLMDGRRIFSCQTLVSEVEGKSITTIEGLSDGSKLHPLQQAFLDEGAYQCGYCISGMVIAAVGLLNKTPHPTDAEICEGMNGNLCRCCGYARITNAVRKAAGGVA